MFYRMFLTLADYAMMEYFLCILLMYLEVLLLHFMKLKLIHNEGK